MAVDPHALAEARSLEMHREIVARLRADPSRLRPVRARVEAWIRDGRPYAAAWAELLAGDPERLFATMIDPGERARAMRQSTPFAGVLDPRTRWLIHARVRANLESPR